MIPDPKKNNYKEVISQAHWSYVSHIWLKICMR
jgi:hypothetical protein